MSTKSAERAARNSPPVPNIDALFPVRTTIPGFVGTQLLTAFTGSYTSLPIGSSLTANTLGVLLGTIVATVDEYDPDFVASILAADAAEPEASFDNVVDLLEWLDRD
jgi:hypothetical protein